MNETLKTILTRRSIRKYTPEQLKEDELQAILEAGKFAPTAMNQQPWHFTVIQNKDLLFKINDMCKAVLIKIKNQRFEELSKKAKIADINLLYNAPTLIIVSGYEKAAHPQADCSIALENMFLAAESLSIGSCWIHALVHLFSDAEGREFLINESIGPKDHIVYGSAVFGYKAVEATPAPRKRDSVTIIR